MNKSKYTNSKNLVVNSFHNYCLKRVSNKFDIISSHADKSIEIAELKDEKVLCIMFHPERSNTSQKRIDNYITKFFKKMNIVFLAAGKSSRIFKVLKKPKCLLNIKNKTIIQKLIDNFKNCNVKKINIVVGFKANLIKDHLKNHKKINYIFNKDYSKKEMLYSMVLALKKINDDIIFSYTDIIYKPSIAKSLSKKRKYIFLPVLCNWKKIWKIRKKIFLQMQKKSKLIKN